MKTINYRERTDMDLLPARNVERRFIHNIDELVEVACEIYNLTEQELLEQNNQPAVVYIRDVIYYLTCMRFPKLSLKTIGRRIGHRDHSTVIHGREKVRNAINKPKTNLGLNLVYKTVNDACLFVCEDHVNVEISQKLTAIGFVEVESGVKKEVVCVPVNNTWINPSENTAILKYNGSMCRGSIIN